MNNSTKQQIKIRLFGAYRRYGNTLNVSVAPNAVANDLKPALAAALKEKAPQFNKWALIEHSRFATGSKLIDNDQPLTSYQELAVLPPVSGG